MPPPMWATATQLEFLVKQLPEYLKIRTLGRARHSTAELSRFFLDISTEFLATWSETAACVEAMVLDDRTLDTTYIWTDEDRETERWGGKGDGNDKMISNVRVPRQNPIHNRSLLRLVTNISR